MSRCTFYVPAVLISIKPKYCELIAAGKKTIEVRKTRPKIETPFKCYIYCTLPKERFSIGQGNYACSDNLYLCDNKVKFGEGFEDIGNETTSLNGKVIGEFVCDEIYQYTTCDAKDGVDISDGEMTRMSCLTKDEIMNYELSPGYFGVFGWHISDLVIYDKPKELSEFMVIDKDVLKECPYRIRAYNNPDCTNGALLKGTYVCNNSFEPDFCRGQCGIATKLLTRPPQSWCYVEELK